MADSPMSNLIALKQSNPSGDPAKSVAYQAAQSTAGAGSSGSLAPPSAGASGPVFSPNSSPYTSDPYAQLAAMKQNAPSTSALGAYANSTQGSQGFAAPSGLKYSGNMGVLMGNAKSWLGTPYAYGGTSRSGVDCSGFTQAVYNSMGINIGRDTSAQFGSGAKVGVDGNFQATAAQLQPGDLVFYGQPGATGPNAHVALYVGNGQVMQAPHTGASVDVVPLYSAASSDEPFLGARRYMNAG